MNKYKSIFHRDGTITYWSVYDQRWVHRASHIPDKDLATFFYKEYEKAQKHLKRAEQPS